MGAVSCSKTFPSADNYFSSAFASRGISNPRRFCRRSMPSRLLRSQPSPPPPPHLPPPPRCPPRLPAQSRRSQARARPRPPPTTRALHRPRSGIMTRSARWREVSAWGGTVPAVGGCRSPCARPGGGGSGVGNRCDPWVTPCVPPPFGSGGAGDGRLAGGVGREHRLLLLLEHPEQRGDVGAATVPGDAGPGPAALPAQVGETPGPAGWGEMPGPCPRACPSLPLLFLSGAVAGTNGGFVAGAELYPPEKGAAPGSVSRGAGLAKREVKKVSALGSGCPRGFLSSRGVSPLPRSPKRGPPRSRGLPGLLPLRSGEGMGPGAMAAAGGLTRGSACRR